MHFSRKIVLTRPAPESENLAKKLASQGWDAVIAPMIEICPFADELPLSGDEREANTAKPRIEQAQALIFTSINAVRCFAGREAGPKVADVRHIPVLTVGGKTASQAKAAGFENVTEAGGDMTSLLTLLRKCRADAGPLFYLRGTEISQPLKPALEEKGFHVYEHILYQARKARALPPALIRDLEAGRLAAILFFSKRSAEAFTDLIKSAGLSQKLGTTKALCLSTAVLESVSVLPYEHAYVSAQKTEESMIALLDRYAPPGCRS